MLDRDLHTVFQSLSDQSLKTSRRLDDTYYSILEKNSTLQQTIGTLQDLSGLTKTLQANFESDTKELVNQVSGQVAGYDNFQSSQRQVNALEERIKLGKQKADSLTARLARARERVYRRARSEAQWQATNTRSSFTQRNGFSTKFQQIDCASFGAFPVSPLQSLPLLYSFIVSNPSTPSSTRILPRISLRDPLSQTHQSQASQRMPLSDLL